MDLSPWRSKTVALSWAGHDFAFDVSQELFSSNAVDQGSLLLLKSLPWEALAGVQRIVDFGCGYGPLGVVATAMLAGAGLTMIDRDALAVAFARENVTRNLPARSVDVIVGLDLTGPAPGDLLLWNVPGKAGGPVLRGLCAQIPAALAPGGLAALVVVNPLAGVIEAALQALPRVTIAHSERHTAHTVIHARRDGSMSDAGRQAGAFTSGVFDREERIVELGDLGYAFKPVYGLPEYENPDFTTEVAIELLASMGKVDSCLIHQPGQGHVALATLLLNGTRTWTLTGRDLLALEATRRNLVINGVAPDQARLAATVGLRPEDQTDPVAFVIAMLDDQLNPARVERLVVDLARAVPPEHQALIAGRSTSVTRVVNAATRAGSFRVGRRLKRHGASAIILRRLQPGSG